MKAMSQRAKSTENLIPSLVVGLLGFIGLLGFMGLLGFVGLLGLLGFIELLESLVHVIREILDTIFWMSCSFT
jgi:hypothetical protein